MKKVNSIFISNFSKAKISKKQLKQVRGGESTITDPEMADEIDTTTPIVVVKPNPIPKDTTTK